MKERIANDDWANRLIELELANEALQKQIAALKIEKLKLDSLTSELSVGAIIADGNYTITHCNKRFYNILNIPESTNLIGQDICRAFEIASENFYHSDRYQVRFKKIIYDKIPIESNKLELKNGRILDLKYTPVIDNNIVGSIIITLRDITESYSKDHSNRLDKIWQNAIEGSNEGVWDWNLKTNQVYFSPKWKKMLGYEINEIKHSFDEWESRVHPDDLKNTISKVKSHINGETEYYQSEHRLQCKDGTYKWILDRGKVVARDENNQPLRMVGTHADITERKTAELELKRTNEILDQGRKLFMLGNVIIFRAKNKEGWPIDYISPNIKNVLGYTESEIYAPSFNYNQLVYHRDIKQRFGDSMITEDSCSESSFYNAPYRLVKKNGETIWVHEFTQIIRNKRNKITGYAGYLVDVSDMVETKMELMLNQKKLQQLNETKDKFLSIIAHDLKGSFNSLIGFSDILLENIENNEYDNLQRFTQIIHNTSNRTYLLFTNLLNWIKKQSKKIKINPLQISASNILNETIEVSKHLANEKQITVSSDLKNDITFTADKNMVFTVLRNLVSNGIKFVDRGGAIKLNAELKNEFIEFSVSDNGVGISKENICKLFNERETVTTVGTNYEKGTGLGLLICKEFIKQHKGKIWVESEENIGTTFKFTVPKVFVTKKDKKVVSVE